MKSLKIALLVLMTLTLVLAQRRRNWNDINREESLVSFLTLLATEVA